MPRPEVGTYQIDTSNPLTNGLVVAVVYASDGNVVAGGPSADNLNDNGGGLFWGTLDEPVSNGQYTVTANLIASSASTKFANYLGADSFFVDSHPSGRLRRHQWQDRDGNTGFRAYLNAHQTNNFTSFASYNNAVNQASFTRLSLDYDGSRAGFFVGSQEVDGTNVSFVSDPAQRTSIGNVSLVADHCFVWDRVLSAAELVAVNNDPWQVFKLLGGINRLHHHAAAGAH